MSMSIFFFGLDCSTFLHDQMLTTSFYLAGSLSLIGNLSSCHSPMSKSRSLLDRCLLAQAQFRYEEALADDEVSRYVYYRDYWLICR